MKKYVAFVVALLFVAGVAFAANGAMKQSVDGFTVSLDFVKGAPHVGDNTVKITVTDANGKVIKNPVVKIRSYMEQEKITEKAVKMSYMTVPVDLKHKGTSCVATVEFTMAGPWVIDMKVKKDGGFADTSFKVDVK